MISLPQESVVVGRSDASVTLQWKYGVASSKTGEISEIPSPKRARSTQSIQIIWYQPIWPMVTNTSSKFSSVLGSVVFSGVFSNLFLQVFFGMFFESSLFSINDLFTVPSVIIGLQYLASAYNKQ